VILINLLPHRLEASQHRRQDFQLALRLAALVGLLVSCAFYWQYSMRISDQQGKNQTLQAEIASLDGQIKEIAGLEQEMAALSARQSALEGLQGKRNLPVYLFDDLVRQMPDGVYISSLKQENQAITLVGVAQSNQQVSDLLHKLANNSAALTHPELLEIAAATEPVSASEAGRVSNFTIRLLLRQPKAVPLAMSFARATASGDKKS